MKRKHHKTLNTMNIMTVEGHKAMIEYDPEIDMFRGEILVLK